MILTEQFADVERVPAEPEADAQSEPGSEVNLSTITVLSHSRIDVPSAFQGLTDAAPLLDEVVAQAREIYKTGVPDVLPCFAPPSPRGYIARPWVAFEIAAPTPVLPPTPTLPTGLTAALCGVRE